MLLLWGCCCCAGSHKGQNQRASPTHFGMELIEIPAGKFTVGSRAGEKNRQGGEEQVAVSLTNPFMLGKTEVTQKQWKQVMKTEPWDGQQYVQANKDCPATFVSFYDAVEFCDALTDLERKAGKLKGNEEYAKPVGALRHARQRVGVVCGLVRRQVAGWHRSGWPRRGLVPRRPRRQLSALELAGLIAFLRSGRPVPPTP